MLLAIDLYICYVYTCSGDVETGSKLHVFKGTRPLKKRKGGRGKGGAAGGGGGGKEKDGRELLVGHHGHVLALAISSDGKYLVSSRFHVTNYVHTHTHTHTHTILVHKSLSLVQFWSIKVLVRSNFGPFH